MMAHVLDLKALWLLCEQLAEASHRGELLPDVVVLHSRTPFGLKNQRVQLQQGLSGVVSSDDGKELCLLYQDIEAWLARQEGGKGL